MEIIFLQKYLIIELFEKIVRINKFINTAYNQDKRDTDKQLLKLYEQVLMFISNEINDFCISFPEDKDSKSILENMMFISKIFRNISNIHNELRNISNVKILPEITTFLKNLDSKNNKLIDYNIVLTDNYSFKERNLSNKILNELKDSFRKEPNLDKVYSFLLPKIEFSNPLNWSILVHEYGHLILKENTEKIFDVFKKKVNNIKPSEEQRYKNWIEEMLCDIFASKMIGPAYLTSFLSYSMLNIIESNLYSNTHPSIFIRAENIKSYLHRNNANFDSDNNINNYGKIFNDLMVSIYSQMNVSELVPDNDIELTAFLRIFRKEIKKMESLKIDNQNKDTESIKLLISKLNKGMPIGTKHKYSINKEEINKTDLDSMTTEEILNWKKNAIEVPSTHWEILNSAWIYKIEYIKNNIFKIFFNSSNDINYKLDYLLSFINKLDDILLHSISTSQIIDLIEK